MIPSQREQVDQIKAELAKLYHSQCFVCRTKRSKSGMTFHHLWYEQDERVYSDFKNTLDYYEYLKPRIIINPKRFLYVCNPHHQAIERLARWKKNLPRLLKAVRLTHANGTA